MFNEVIINLLYLFQQLIVSKQFLFIASMVLIVLVLKWQSPKLKGVFGEWQVKSKLKRLGEEYTSFHNLYIPTPEGRMAQVDHIVTSPYGLFVIETKHYNGWIFGNEFTPDWAQVIYQKQFKMYNPIRQNYGHIQSLIAYLDKVDHETVHSVIAFSTQSTFKFTQSFQTATVIQFPELLKAIRAYRVQCISRQSIQEINSQLERLVVKDLTKKRQIKQKHRRMIQEVRSKKMKNRISSTSTGKPCPKCQGHLQLKSGRYGKFYGCTNYPNCRYTEKEMYRKN